MQNYWSTVFDVRKIKHILNKDFLFILCSVLSFYIMVIISSVKIIIPQDYMNQK